MTKKNHLEKMADDVIRYAKLKALVQYEESNGDQLITANHWAGPASLCPATLDEYLDLVDLESIAVSGVIIEDRGR